MRIKSKPKKPVRKKNIREYYEIYDGNTLSDIILKIDSNIDLSDVRFSVSYDRWDEEADVAIHLIRDETDEEFEKRMQSYNKRLASYNEWYDKNKDQIEEELAKRAELKKQKETHKAEQQQKQAEKKIKEAEKEIKRLKKILDSGS